MLRHNCCIQKLFNCINQGLRREATYRRCAKRGGRKKALGDVGRMDEAKGNLRAAEIVKRSTWDLKSPKAPTV